MAKTDLGVSVVITVLNEQDNIKDLIKSLKSQTLSPAKIVIVDGGSTDSTWQILKDQSRLWTKLFVFQHKGNRSVGRNFGVAQLQTPLIAFTDAGCLPNPDWLKHLIRPFHDSAVQVVSGYYQGLYTNTFQKCLLPFVLVMPDQAGKTEFFPSTRSMALTRQIWNLSGGFDTRLSHNEDYAFAHWLKKLGVNFTFAPLAVVRWFPRKNLKSAAWMFTRFAIGDIQSGIIRPQVKKLFIRYFIFTFSIFYLIEISWVYPIFIVMFIYIFWAINKNYKYVHHPAAIFWLPVLQITADISVMFGSTLGWLGKTYGIL